MGASSAAGAASVVSQSGHNGNITVSIVVLVVIILIGVVLGISYFKSK